MKLHVTPISSHKFSVHCTGGRISLVTELSDLLPSQTIHAQRLYDDACDVGLAVKSEKTGRVATFVMSSVDEREGEVSGWTYTPTRETSCAMPELAAVTVLVIND